MAPNRLPWRDTSARTIRSENQYDTRLVTAANRKRDDHSLRAAEDFTDQEEQAAQHAEQQRRFQSVGHGCGGTPAVFILQ